MVFIKNALVEDKITGTLYDGKLYKDDMGLESSARYLDCGQKKLLFDLEDTNCVVEEYEVEEKKE
jgi:hypothetical protein